MGDTVTNWLTVIIAFLSLVAFISLQHRQTSILKKQTDIQDLQTEIQREQLEFQKRQTAIIEYQEQERRKAKLKAKLTPDIEMKTDHPRIMALRIHNAGSAAAKNLKVNLDKVSIEEYPKKETPALSPSSPKPTEIKSGATVTYVLQLTPEKFKPGSRPSQVDVEIWWNDDSDEPGYDHRALSLGRYS
jgi:hypothetical protein